MQNFHELIADVLNNGSFKPNRTGVSAFSSIGHMVKYDLTEGKLAALTTKRLAFDSAKGELLAFFRGNSNAADFRALGCNVWNQNANENASWLANPARKGHDDLGAIYGVQWTSWRDTRYARTKKEAQDLERRGFKLMAFDKKRYVRVYERRINQLEHALKQLIENPNDRGIVVSAWRVDELDRMALRPCHVDYWFGVDGDNRLHGTLWMRSNDLFLGHPFNAVSMAIFTHVLARLSGREAASATIFISDAHVYENHVQQSRTMLEREHFPAPHIAFSPRIKAVTDLSEISGIFERIEPSDIWMEGYQSHGKLAGAMAV